MVKKKIAPTPARRTCGAPGLQSTRSVAGGSSFNGPGPQPAEKPDSSIGQITHAEARPNQGYALPRLLRYREFLRNPILEAFFFTASVLRPSCLAILAVGLFGKSFLSLLTSAVVQPLTTRFRLAVFFLAALALVVFFFLAILRSLSINDTRLNLSLHCRDSAAQSVLYV